MAEKAVRVYTLIHTPREYEQAVADGDGHRPDPADDLGELYPISEHAKDLGHWNTEHTAWIPATDIQTAAHLLSGTATGFWAAQCSDTPAEIGPGAWYMDEPHADQATGDVTTRSARLEGDWSVHEARAIRALVIAH